MDSTELTIDAYSRADALADGMLIDVSDQAFLVGFKVPVAMSCAAWSQSVEWTEADSQRQGHQDQSGRLWDVLTLCFCAAARTATDELTFSLNCLSRNGKRVPVVMVLKAVIDGGDDGKPVLTIMLPDED